MIRHFPHWAGAAFGAIVRALTRRRRRDDEFWQTFRQVLGDDARDLGLPAEYHHLITRNPKTPQQGGSDA